jgi:hypothetical protein
MDCAYIFATAVLAAVALSSNAAAQPAAGRGGRGGPAVVSPEISADGHVTFRILAPDANKVTFLDNDFGPMLSAGGPGPIAGSTTPAVPAGLRVPQGGLTFTKNQNGIWEASFGPLPPGAYRYAFQVDFESSSAEFNRINSAQVAALNNGEGFLFADYLAAAGLRMDRAKHAIIAHEEEHGCAKTLRAVFVI